MSPETVVFCCIFLIKAALSFTKATAAHQSPARSFCENDFAVVGEANVTCVSRTTAR